MAVARHPDLRLDRPFSPQLGRIRDTKRPKLFVANVLAAKELAGFGARGRGLRSARPSVGRGGVAAWWAGRALLSSRGRRVVVKARIVRHGPRMTPLAAHLAYLRREGVTHREQGRMSEPARMFDATSDDADIGGFAQRAADDRHHFRFIVSPEDAGDLTDLRGYTRDLVAEMVRDLGIELDWVAVDHWNTDNPHVHLVVRGAQDDGRGLVIHRDYITQGIRARAQELVEIELGPRAEHEIRSKLAGEVTKERWTELDRSLKRVAISSDDGIIDMSPQPDGVGEDKQLRGLLIGRLQRLEAMGLAQTQGPAQWRLREDAEPVLREMGIRGDIIRTMNRSLGAERTEAMIHGAAGPEQPVTGRVAAKGLDDELAGKPYVVVEGIDGRTHYVRLGSAVDLNDIPETGIVRAGPSRNGKWASLRVLSDFSLDEQVTAKGATWLDRELVAREKSVLAPTGFGAEVRDALDRRSLYLIAENLGTRRGQQILFASDLLGTLERRELETIARAISDETGYTPHAVEEGERAGGVYQRRMTLTSGRFALIVDEIAQEFSLVPWRHEVERAIGQEVSAVIRGRSVEWRLGRDRGLEIG